MRPDIKLAIKKELEFIQDKIYKKKENITINEYVKEAGYENIKDFYNDKIQYMLKSIHLDIIEKPNVIPEYAEEYINENKSAMLYNIHPGEHYVFLSDDAKEFKLIKTDDKDIKTVRLGYKSKNAIIVSADGDLRIYVIIPMFTGIGKEWFLKKMKKYLEKYYYNVSISEDSYIKIKGKNVIRSVETEKNNMLCIMFTVAFVDSTSVIKNVNEINGNIDDGFIDPKVISPEEFVEEFASWVN